MLPALRRLAAIAIVVCALSCAGAGETLARSTDGAWEAGAYVGVGRFANETQIEEAFLFGLRGGWHLKAIHQFEIDFDSGSADHSVKATGVEFDMKKIGLTYNRNFFPKGNEKFEPLVSFGIGRMMIDAKGPGGSADDSPTFLRAGGGTRYFFTPRVGMRVEGKIYRWRGDGIIVNREGFFSFDLTAGITVLFAPKK